MKFTYAEIDKVFDTAIDKVNTMIIENPQLLYRLRQDLQIQIESGNGKSVISKDDRVLDTAKYIEILDHFFPFELNKKTLLSKLSARIEKLSIENDYYEDTMKHMAELEKFFIDICNELPGDIQFSKFYISSVIKAIGAEFEENYESLAEKVVDYIELVSEYDREKLFIIVNLRSYVSDEDTEAFMDTIIRKQYNVIMIETNERDHLLHESRYVIDKSLCEIAVD